MPRFNIKITFENVEAEDGERFTAFANGRQVGDVFTVKVQDREYTQWQFEGNPYARATYRSRYWAARKMIERQSDIGRASRIAKLNGEG